MAMLPANDMSMDSKFSYLKGSLDTREAGVSFRQRKTSAVDRTRANSMPLDISGVSGLPKKSMDD